MHRFWDTIIEPAVKILRPESILEIGSDLGTNTKNLLAYCGKNNAILHVVDPVPKYDMAAWQKEYGDFAFFYKSLSLNAIPKIGRFDLVLIDGDHNWYTVYNELKLIEKCCLQSSMHFPLVMLHDIGWPYGRRDLYYNPENIPEVYRKPCKQKGISPESAELLEEGGLNSHLFNSIYENNLQNGVLTACEDFVEESGQKLEFLTLHGLFGLGIIFSRHLSHQNKELEIFFEELEVRTAVKRYLERIEKARIESELLLCNKKDELKKVMSEGKERINELKGRHEENINELKGQHEERINELKGQHEEKINELKGQHEEKIEQIEGELKKRALEVKMLGQWVEQLITLISEILNSNRWKIGNRIGDILRMLTLKHQVPMAGDRLEELTGRFEAWKAGDENIVIPEKMPASNRFSLHKPGEKQKNPEKKSISIIILNRDGAKHLKNFFQSFLANNTYQNINFIVVDHGSSDDSIEILRSFKLKFPVEIILYDTNNSFSHSNNIAAKRSSSDYLLFLNNDIIFQQDPIPALVKQMNDTSIGVAGIRLLYPAEKTGSKRSILKKLKTGDKFSGKVQHAGIKFNIDTAHGFFRPYNLSVHSDTSAAFAEPGIFPAVTGAAMLCRREEFLSIGGFCEKYVYGYEDVDLCLTCLAKLNKMSYSANKLSLVHAESATAKLSASEKINNRRRNNQAILMDRYGYSIRKAFYKDLVAGNKFWTDQRLKIAFAVTEASENAKAGDYFTALELSNAFVSTCRWDVGFMARNRNWYDLQNTDVLIVMVDAFDLTKIYNAKPGLVKIAWMRNWFDRWSEREWFDDYDIYLCSSNKGSVFISEQGKKVHHFPIATNENRFKPDNIKEEAPDFDYCFTGHKWGALRDIEVMLDPEKLDYRFAVFGNGWERHNKFGKYWKGFVQYSKLPSIYSKARVVIDDAVHHITKQWGSVNSRVFDALASGALVISNGVEGSDDLFKGELPTYKTGDELKALLDMYLGDENLRRETAANLQKSVLESHTYTRRALKIKSILADFYGHKFRIAIKVPVPKRDEAHMWGDYHFALALKRSLVKFGHSVRVDLMPNWYTPLGLGDDVVIVLRGLSRYAPRPGQINLMWLISHPDKIDLKEHEEYDHIFAASLQYSAKLKEQTSTPVSALLQCTDTKLFYPETKGDVPAHEVLFVGNSRKKYRKIVKDAIESDISVSIYGVMWEDIVPAGYIKGTHIKNTSLRYYYTKSKVILNDHWPSMGENGFVSNRIFDAGACGACIVSDRVSGIFELFGDAVVTYSNKSELKSIIDDLLSDETKRKTYGRKLRKIVSEKHGFENRADTILQVIEQIASNKPKLACGLQGITFPQNKQTFIQSSGLGKTKI